MTRADRVVMAFEAFVGAKIDAALTEAYDEDNVADPEHGAALTKLNESRNQLVSILMALLAKEDLR